MKALFISGGATKFIALIAAAKELVESYNYRPRYYFGNSAGSITALLSAMGKFQEGINTALEMDLDSIFDKKPVNKKGSLTIGAIIRILTGKNYLGSMGNLENLLRYVVSEDDFYNWSNSTVTPEVGVLVVNGTTRERKMLMLKELEYDQAIKAVIASCSIPLAVPPVEIDGELYYDGGLRDHCPSPYVFQKMPQIRISDFVSIYSRPENLEGIPRDTNWVNSLKDTFFDVVMGTMNYEISKNDVEFEEAYSHQFNVRGQQVFIPHFLNHLFDMDRDRLRKGYELGIKSVRTQYGWDNS